MTYVVICQCVVGMLVKFFLFEKFINTVYAKRTLYGKNLKGKQQQGMYPNRT
jgi:hypothetical protein